MLWKEWYKKSLGSFVLGRMAVADVVIHRQFDEIHFNMYDLVFPVEEDYVPQFSLCRNLVGGCFARGRVMFVGTDGQHIGPAGAGPRVFLDDYNLGIQVGSFWNMSLARLRCLKRGLTAFETPLDFMRQWEKWSEIRLPKRSRVVTLLDL